MYIFEIYAEKKLPEFPYIAGHSYVVCAEGKTEAKEIIFNHNPNVTIKKVKKLPLKRGILYYNYVEID